MGLVVGIKQLLFYLKHGSAPKLTYVYFSISGKSSPLRLFTIYLPKPPRSTLDRASHLCSATISAERNLWTRLPFCMIMRVCERARPARGRYSCLSFRPLGCSPPGYTACGRYRVRYWSAGSFFAQKKNFRL